MTLGVLCNKASRILCSMSHHSLDCDTLSVNSQTVFSEHTSQDLHAEQCRMAGMLNLAWTHTDITVINVAPCMHRYIIGRCSWMYAGVPRTDLEHSASQQLLLWG